MRSLAPTKESLDFIRALEPKHFKQVMNKVLGFLVDPTPADASALKGCPDLFRADIGECRIVYRFDEKSVSLLVVYKRNDDEVYKNLPARICKTVRPAVYVPIAVQNYRA